jgi:hypothetical protein
MRGRGRSSLIILDDWLFPPQKSKKLFFMGYITFEVRVGINGRELIRRCDLKCGSFCWDYIHGVHPVTNVKPFDGVNAMNTYD